ncbi:hypothetical protein HK098_004667 [Nowakowskiella sp. JEL0407]|nr:hypothetical protein HK098_004667 [Nowakowskiella sp. JEL0407]
MSNGIRISITLLFLLGLCDKSDDAVDPEIFGELLFLDDDGAFARDIVKKYFKQAYDRMPSIETSFEAKDLDELYKHAHFLKGSSAMVGLRRINAIFEKIQYHTKLKDESGKKNIPESEAWIAIESLIKQSRVEHRSAEEELTEFFNELEFE